MAGESEPPLVCEALSVEEERVGCGSKAANGVEECGCLAE